MNDFPETRRELGRLNPDDRVRPLVELVFEVEDLAVTAAVVRKLLAEIATERGGSRTNFHAGRESKSAGATSPSD